MTDPILDKQQTAINGYIEGIRFKLQILTYQMRDIDWGNLVHTQEVTLERLKAIHDHLIAGVQLLPVERNKNVGT